MGIRILTEVQKRVFLDLGMDCTDISLIEEVGNAPFVKLIFASDPRIDFGDRVIVRIGDQETEWTPKIKTITADYKKVMWEYVCEKWPGVTA